MAIHISASALKDFVICSQRTYFRIFESGVSVPTKEMLMGTITHKVLEKEWKDISSALALASRLCTENKLDAQSYQAIEHFISTYFERFRLMVTDEDQIEKRFKIKMYDDVYLTGTFDRITRGLVIDWKTDANPPKKIDNHIQFMIYDLAYNLLYDKGPSGVYLAALKDGSLVRYNESPQHKDTLINQVIPKFVETIRKKSFVKTGLFTGACYRCPYKLQCLGGGSDVMVRSDTIEK